MRSFVKIKSSRNGENILSFSDIGKSCHSRDFITSQICLFSLFARIKFSRKFPKSDSDPFWSSCDSLYWGESVHLRLISLTESAWHLKGKLSDLTSIFVASTFCYQIFSNVPCFMLMIDSLKPSRVSKVFRFALDVLFHANSWLSINSEQCRYL